MKNVMKYSGFGVLFLVLVLLYLRYDKTGYYYGVECSFCNRNKRLNIVIGELLAQIISGYTFFATHDVLRGAATNNVSTFVASFWT